METKNPIEFLDLSAPYLELQPSIDKKIADINQKGWFLLGDELKRFEANFAKFTGAKHCAGVANGLDALTLILRGYEIGMGDEVIVPAHTFIATWLAVSATGATVVPVEVDEASMNIDAELTAEKITPKTKAIIAVHLYGQSANIHGLKRIIGNRDIKIIEDAAQAHGASHHGQPCGSLGHAAGFSFYPGKNLGALGDGGAITTSDDALLEKLHSLRNYGAKVKYHHDDLGVNSRLDEIQAGVLDLKLTVLAKWNKRRAKIAEIYSARLNSIAEVRLPTVSPENEPVWHLYVIRTQKRDALQKYLKDRDISTLIHYPVPCHLSGAYHFLHIPKGTFPVTERISDTALSLPIGPHMPVENASRVANEVASFFNR